MSVQRRRFSASLAVVFLLLGTGCSVVQEYDVNIKDLDTEVTLFEQGLSVPLGSTNKIELGTLLNSQGQNIQDFLKADDNGVLLLTYSGNTSLTQQIQDLKLSDMAKTDAVNINQEFTYHLGDVDPDKFSIDGKQVNVDFAFPDVSSIDMSIPAVNTNLNAIKAGLDKYANVIENNKNLNIPELGHSQTVNQVAALATAASAAAAAAGGNANTEFAIYDNPLGKELLPDVTVGSAESPVTIKVNPSPIKLSDDITCIDKITLDPGAKMTLSLKMSTPFISSGQLVPELNLDLSSVFNIKGGSVLDLSDLVLSNTNSWTASKTYDIAGLATTKYGNPDGTDPAVISIDENISLYGTVVINDPKTTLNTVSGNSTMKIELDITFSSLALKSAEVTVKDIAVDEYKDVVNIGSESAFAVPEDIKTVKVVEMDPTKPITLTLAPSSTALLSKMHLPYTIELEFPDYVDVQGATGGKLTFSDDLSKGTRNHDIVITALHPTVENHAVAVNAEVKVKANVTATGIKISTDDLPSSAADDITFNVSVTGNPAIKDVVVTTNTIEKETAQPEEVLEFPIEGMDGMGSFTITPSGTPAVSVDFNLPSIPGLNIVPGTGADAVVMTLPDLFTFDTSSLPAQAQFSAEKHTITLVGGVPANITLPITSIHVVPVEDDGKYKVKTSYKVDGKIFVECNEETGVRQQDFNTVSGQKFGIVVDIPKITAKTIDMDEALSINIDKEYDLDFNLKTEGRIKTIQEVILDGVNFNMAANFSGLPDMGGDEFEADLTLVLPEFIEPSNIPIKGKIHSNGKLADQAPVKIERLKNIDLNGGDKVTGKVKITGTISAPGQNIDLSSLQSDVTGTITASIADKDGKISISSAKGIFTYDISENTTVKLDNMPDILKKDGVKVDLADPQITLDLKTNLGVAMKGTIEIIPVIGGVESTENKLKLEDIVMPYATSAAAPVTKKFVVCQTKDTAPAGYEVLIAPVSKLLTPIPDELKLSVQASVDSETTSIVETSAAYTFDIDYGIKAPLAFGADFSFGTTSEFDLSSIAQFASMGTFTIKGKAVNDSPLIVDLNLDLLDDQGALIPLATPCATMIKGNDTSDITLTLNPTDKTRKIAKGKLTLNVTAVPGVALKNTSSVQLTDLVAEVPEGVNYKF